MPGQGDAPRGRQLYVAYSVYGVVLKKLIPAQIRQIILYISNDKGYVGGFVRELTFAQQLCKHFV